MTNVILCGGNGTRLWPLSRKEMPKQFIKLVGENSLFQDTILRNSKLCANSIIVCNEKHFFLVEEQIEQIKPLLPLNYKYQIILESIGRNTAAAISLATFAVNKNDLVLVTPCDHFIEPLEQYIQTVNSAIEYAKDDFITLFGLTPKYPETGYGYIKATENNIEKFIEKPSLEKAMEYVQSDKYYWNSGIFCFKAGVFLKILRELALEIYESSSYAFESSKKQKRFLVNEYLMKDIPNLSIDIAVMEKCYNLKVVKGEFYWSDLGSFCSIYKALPQDENRNVLKYDEMEPILVESKDNLVISKKRQVALLHVDNIAVIDTPDALLVVNKDKTQEVKNIVDNIEKVNTKLTIENPLVHRPWGTYNVIEESEKYKFKTIVVKPKKRLSLQKHYHRNEHWIVLKGTATVTIGKKKRLVRSNESVYIPMGKKHRLANDGKIDLVLIEVQVGEYLEEDDIVRYSDDFKRNDE